MLSLIHCAFQIQVEQMRTTYSKRHMRTVHIDQSIKKFLCDQCPFSSHALQYLTDHKRQKHGVEHKVKEHGKNAVDNVFLCERCKKTFAERGYLQHHVCNQGNLSKGVDNKTIRR